ncbi:hypothetical protein SXCC_01200 [Gluconacetobacter sp. SXCC-1]|nr:hypothetical protein SXCC_01200 [Gluconacetobacter sp. SXCC-1]
MSSVFADQTGLGSSGLLPHKVSAFMQNTQDQNARLRCLVPGFDGADFV